MLWPRAERDEVAAVVLVGEAVFKAVGAVAFVAVHTGHEGRINQRFTAWVGALLLVGEDVGFRGEGGVACWTSSVCVGALAGPLAGVGTVVGGFGAVI